MSFERLCVARGRANEWEALCLDLDIAVQGQSFDEVRNRLSDAIATYLEDAAVEAEPHRTRLLTRRAPLSVRLLWAWRFSWAALRGRNPNSDSAVGFPVACPA